MRHIYSGAIALMTGIACGAVAYAAKEGNAMAVVLFVSFVAGFGGLLAAARDDK